MTPAATQTNLEVALGRLHLRNPILVASGTFGYAREMQGLVDFSKLGGILPKRITLHPRLGNAPWRSRGDIVRLLNSIGLDNDGVETFIEQHLTYLRTIDSAIVVSIAGKSRDDEFVELAKRIEALAARRALELNISCPNVFWWCRLWTDPSMCHDVSSMRCKLQSANSCQADTECIADC